MSVATILLLAVLASRLFELWLSARHERALKARGAFEVGAAHYPALVALHAGWLTGLFLGGRDAPVSPFWLGVFLLLQIARIWTLSSLGERWTTRILVMPDAPLVRRGPYRFARHPNYLIVTGEIATLPLALGMPLYALLFSVANAIVLCVRIQCEDVALGRSQKPDQGKTAPR